LARIVADTSANPTLSPLLSALSLHALYFRPLPERRKKKRAILIFSPFFFRRFARFLADFSVTGRERERKSERGKQKPPLPESCTFPQGVRARPGVRFIVKIS
jgi:hypothetical protein